MLPIFPLDLVLFPGGEISLSVSDEDYKKLMLKHLESAEPIGMIYGVETDESEASICNMGCLAYVTNVKASKKGEMSVVLKGGERFSIQSCFEEEGLIYTDEYQVVSDKKDLQDSDELLNSVNVMCDQFWGMIADVDPMFLSEHPQEKLKVERSYQLLSMLNLNELGRQKALETISVKDRFKFALTCLKREIETLHFLMQGENQAIVAVN